MGEGLAKQAKTLTDTQIKRALAEGATRRYPERDRVMVRLSVKGGIRAKEIAMVTWGMVTDAEGNVGDALHLLNGASKGKKGGRTARSSIIRSSRRIEPAPFPPALTSRINETQDQ